MAANKMISVQIFSTYIVEKLRRENPHIACAYNESKNVLSGAVVHIPQAGASPEVVKNRSQFPATAVQRGDTDITYALDTFSTTPTHISWDEANEISYDKTDSVLADHVATLVETIGDNLFYYWTHGKKQNSAGDAYVDDVLPVANRIHTTGELVDVNAEDGQTGKRKALSYKDLQTAQAKMNKAGVPKTDRYACLESYMYQQFIDSLNANQMAAFQKSADLENGIAGRFAGFAIMERATVLAFAADGTILQPGQAFAATTNIGCLCWQKLSVAEALGDTHPFQDTDNPEYYGDVFSAAVKAGGRCRRKDWKGILAIVQSPADTQPTITSTSSIEADGTEQTINRVVAVSGGFGWSVANDDVDDDWMTVTKDGDMVKVVLIANNGENATERTGSFTITVDGTSVTKQVTVTQAAAV